MLLDFAAALARGDAGANPTSSGIGAAVGVAASVSGRTASKRHGVFCMERKEAVQHASCGKYGVLCHDTSLLCLPKMEGAWLIVCVR